LSHLIRSKCLSFAIHKTFLWTDSKVTLAWIQSNREYKTFVQNRVNGICNVTNPEDWFYCPTKENPTDVITRSELSDPLNSLWWDGPSFLKDTNITRNQRVSLDETEKLPDEKVTAVNAALSNNNSVNNVFDFERYSTYQRTLRTTSWVLRFIRNIKAKLRKETLDLDEILQSKELSQAEIV